MRIVVLDTLIQTVDFDQPVRGGLVKSAILDANALAERHEVFYMYYGKPTYDYKFQSVILDNLGSKDWCLKEKKKVSQAHQKLTKDIPKMVTAISSIKPDAMVIHVCSKSKYLDEITKKFQDIPRLYVFHDGVSNDDLFGTVGILSTVFKLKKYNSFLTVNSAYTRDTITKVMRNREEDIRKFYPGLLEDNVPDVNTYQLFDKVYDYFVYYDNNAKLDIVKNAGFSVNIGRFQKKKGVLDLLQLHKYNNHEVRLYGVQDPVFDPGLKDYKKIKEAEERYEDNYTICEGFSDEELREDAKHGNNIVISCPVEGFGYTAFEMGVFGMPCVILKHGERHATEEYLEKLGAEYVTINKAGNKKWREELYDAMMNTKLSVSEKEENAQRFLDYFTLENYIDEREEFFKLAEEKIKKNKKKTLF
jgi:hypothetical protein